MDIDRSRIRRVFDEAAELSTGDRADFLDRECAGDPELREAVEALLRSLEDAAGFLVTSNTAPLREGVGSRIGPYVLLETIGEGGFGTVFLAEQRTPVVRPVALKIIKLGMDTRQVIARFEAERQALALMNHPGIATVLDAGATETGRPYFVMELVRGKAITAYCDENHLDLPDRLALFVDVCHAVQHAHQKGIVHRDLKPSNILVAVADGRPIPKVIDFGIAKAMVARLTEKTVFTGHRQLIGTPEYMSPEQAEMNAADVDTRSDVYSLGILLYEMLTGTTPVEGRRLRSAAWDEMLRLVAEGPTPKPSTRVSSMHDAGVVAARRKTEPARLARILRGDLDWIAMKCLEKERKRRYQSASELAADLERHLSGEPVLAAPPSTLYRVRKFVRRHRIGVGAGSLVVLAIATAAAGMGVGIVRESRQRAKAERIAAFMEQMLEGVRPSVALGRDTTMLREMLDAAAGRITQGDLAPAPEAELSLRLTMARTYREIGAYEASARMIDPAVELAQHLSGRDGSLGLAAALHERGAQLLGESRPTEGKAALDSALSIRRRLIEGDDPAIADNLILLSDALRDLHRSPEAEEGCRQALEMHRRLGNPRAIARAMRHLAGVLGELGRLPESESFSRQSLETLRRLETGDTPEIAGILVDLAILLREEERFDESEVLFEQALEVDRRIFGNDHPKVANILFHLGGLYQTRGRLPEAIDHYCQALEIHQRFRSGYHDLVALTQEALAFALYQSGRSDEAEVKLRELLASAKTARESDPGLILHAEAGLARLSMDRGRFADAEKILLDAWERRPREDEDYAEVAIRSLAATYEAWDRADPDAGHAGQAAEWRARLPPSLEPR